MLRNPGRRASLSLRTSRTANIFAVPIVMKRSFSVVLFFFQLAISFSQQKNSSSDPSTDYKKAESLYEKADQLSNKADANNTIQRLQDQLYNKALYKFVEAKNSNPAGDSLNFHIFIKIGLINHYLDNTVAAKENYIHAIRLKSKIPSVEDSFLFKPYLFLGGVLYDEHKFDSAFFYYQKAEAIQNNYKVVLEESQRLYNKIGVMYYETGNYRLAKDYFEKALSSLSRLQPAYNSLMVNYKINIASIEVKLGQYDQARKKYEDLLTMKTYENEIRHNLGIINSHLGKFKEAIDDFKKVKYGVDEKNVELDYNLAVAFDNLNQADSADNYLQRAISENKKINGKQKNTPYGLVLKFLGDKEIDKRKYIDGLRYYQQAILQFDISFNDTDIYKNPTQFSGIFSYINLFNTLISKAQAFQYLYETNKQIKDLKTSLDVYQSAFKLTDYVEKVYESDESREFLNQIKYSAHSKPIDLCLQLFKLTKERKYLEQAYFFDQQNKASVLSLNLQLLQIQKQGGAISESLKKENSLRSSITRLSLTAAQFTNAAKIDEANRQIKDWEIQLATVQELLNKDPKYVRLQPTESIPAITTLQNKILDKKTVLISYHLSGKELVGFVVTAKGFNYYQQPIDQTFYNNIKLYVKSLHNVGSDEKYKGDAMSKYFYDQLIKPILPLKNNCDRLVIIPDDELNYLPFESLKSEIGHYLLESFSVQYQYSTALFNIGEANRRVDRGVLAFAPFIDNSFNSALGTLPYSKNEVENLQGLVFTGKDATKPNFIKEAERFAIIHLATHASVNDSFPLRSYISFYPAGNDSSYRLYAGEIYNFHLDSSQLVILSACETGAGQLVRGEGLMSLSRAFAYAGCPNIITSLWKAEDKTTAFIAIRLHYYLQKNYSNDEALRQAKLDLLKSNDIEPRFKTPNYWAHFIFIGNYQPKRSTSYLWIGGVIIFLLAVGFIIKKMVLRKAGPQFS